MSSTICPELPVVHYCDQNKWLHEGIHKSIYGPILETRLSCQENNCYFMKINWSFNLLVWVHLLCLFLHQCPWNERKKQHKSELSVCESVRRQLCLWHWWGIPKTVFNPLGTTGLLTPFLIGSFHELFTYLANHYKALKCSTKELYMRLFFSYTLSDWFNKSWDTPFDQSAGSSHGVDWIRPDSKVE